MGGGTSKVDNYVLRVVDEGLSSPSGGSGKLNVKPSMDRRRSSPAIVAGGDTKQKPQPTLESSPSSAAKESPPEAGKRLKHAVSAAQLKITAVQGFSGKGNFQNCSSIYPWLLKNAKLHGQSVSDFEFGRVIGRGLMGTVRIAKTKSNKYMVMKSIRKDGIVRHNDQRHIQNERLALLTLNCSFCVKLFGTFQDKNCVYFALEYAPGGELFHRLDKKKFFPPDTAKFYISEIFVALEHVQNSGFVYRDLKPENIMLDEEGHCKLVDFGFAIPYTENQRIHTLCGTPAYLSPEQLDGKLTNGYTKIVDWWSFGVLIYELLTGKTPFCRSSKESHYEIFLRILKSKISFPYNFDTRSKELITRLCYSDTSRRLVEPSEIKRHPYFEIEWRAVANRNLVPPFVPRIKDEGDSHYFDQYREPGPERDVATEYRFDFSDF